MGILILTGRGAFERFLFFFSPDYPAFAAHNHAAMRLDRHHYCGL